MLDLLETIAGGVVLVIYLAASVVLPSALIAGFVVLITSLLRGGLDAALLRAPGIARIQVLRTPGIVVRSLASWAASLALFLALVGAASGGLGSAILLVGFTRTIEVLVSLQDAVALAFTGRALNDMLVQTQSDVLLASLRIFETISATHLHQELRPGVTLLSFRWTFAAFATALFVFYVLLEPLRAVRRRVAHEILTVGVRATEPVAMPRVAVAGGFAEEFAPQRPPVRVDLAPQRAPVRVDLAPRAEPPVSERRVDEQAAMAAEAAAAEAALPAAEVVGTRSTLVTRDPLLEEAIRQQLDILGFAVPTVVRSAAQAFTGSTLPSLVLVDARQLQWVNVDHVPLAARLRMVAITQRGAELPAGWHIDTYALESGVHGLLDLLRDRATRRRVQRG